MPVFYGTETASPLMLGTAQYPSPAVLAEAFRRSGAGVATVSIRREAADGRCAHGFCEPRIGFAPTSRWEVGIGGPRQLSNKHTPPAEGRERGRTAPSGTGVA